ncbi:SusD/RagB family nutrient-binding outer membrane lipoprotein [Flavobacterium sp. MR2016-29]|uniref:SusD/RagB family nutrient-binding outer membrane lipoprotein n=1 Tax=Flavobacterium sp. MR2016-29 TaxID=2783795 RepID=UPI00188CA79D|nr:SusD/RagB family nutrient-binding outer membrane lipoprotein [Flavobacterium sp. MR2016-29]MBF4492965.1 SusD/RagB family nutrient-binding outer membrane lipoprotein [Flavobacterium sp. MR2016-29]
MKKIIFSVAILSLFMTGCVNDEADFNDNKDKPYDVPSQTLLTNAEKALADQMTTPSVNSGPFRYLSQTWAATQYTDESRYFFITRKVSDVHWRVLYASVIGNLQSTKDAIAKEVKPSSQSQADFDRIQKNKTAIADILQLYTFQVLVDTFGNIPYSEAVTTGIVLPKYDDAATVYSSLITKLDATIASIDASTSSFSAGDVIYSGNMAKWKLFANSLKVKIGINLVDANPALAKSTIESAYTAGVITTNANNASFKYTTAAPNYSTLYANLVASGRNDFVPTSNIIDAMNTLADPRRDAYFTLYNGVYKGGVYGTANAYANFSHISAKIAAADFPALLFEATEVNFYLAEAAARGLSVGGTVETYYNNAIRASFENWGVAGVDAYLLTPGVAYATAPGTFKEKIGRQAWIGLFNRGFESWTTYRRLDYPVLVAPATASAAAEGVVPKRLTYPINEQTVNNANWTAASTAIGGDKLANKIFWDKL